MALEQLLPERRELDPAEAYGDLALARRARDDRPYVGANMITTLDGRAAVGGRTAPISSDTDRQLFLSLRTQVDAVMVGTATMAIEGYGPLLKSDQQRERRRGLGLEPVPLAVTATRSMELPTQAPLFQDPGSRIVVLTCSHRPAPEAPAEIVVERFDCDELDFGAAIARLRTAHGVRTVLLEGGPTLLAGMVAAGVVDELFLTIAGKLAGSAGDPTVLEGTTLAEPLEARLVSLMRDESFLFARYDLRR